MGFLAPQMPSAPAAPPAPPPQPDVTQVKQDISSQEQLARKRSGRQANILTGGLGDTTTTTTSKTILG